MRRSIVFSPVARKIAFSIGLIVILACAGPQWDEDEFISYFQPETSTTSILLRPMHYWPGFVYDGPASWYNYRDTSDSAYRYDENVAAWYEYTQHHVSKADINRLLNWNEDADSVAIAKLEAGQSVSNSGSPMIDYFARTHNTNALEYLVFAHRANEAEELIDYHGWYWNRNADSIAIVDSVARLKLIPESIAKSSSATDGFLKTRYQFQAVKLQCETEHYENAIALYDKWFNIAPESAIKNLAHARMAGAYLRLEDSARAIYEFSQVFAHSNARKIESYLSLRYWYFTPEALKYCRNDSERCQVYAIMAIQPNLSGLDFLPKMVELDPTNELIELVMAREINRNEQLYYDYPSFGEGRDSLALQKDKTTAQNYFARLRDFALASARNSKLHDPAFWYMAASYMELVQRNYTESAKHLDSGAASTPRNAIVTDQIALQRLLLYVDPLTEITPQAESDLVKLLPPFTNSNSFRRAAAFNYACMKLAALYEKPQHHTIKSGLGCGEQSPSNVEYPLAKALLCRLSTSATVWPGQWGNRPYFMTSSELIPIEDSANTRTFDEAIAFYNAPHHSEFEEWLMSASMHSAQDFYRLRGNRAMEVLDYDEAARNYVHVNDSVWHREPYDPYLKVNPFWTGILDSHKQQKADSIQYTPLQFANKMIVLRDHLPHLDAEEQAKVNFDMGSAMYNLSSRGRAWLMVSRMQGEGDDSLYCLRAKEYFERTTTLTKEREFAARAVWMIAKCNEQQFGGEAYDDTSGGKPWKMSANFKGSPYFSTFTRLHRDYINTEFEQEAIKECGDYHAFVMGAE